MYTADVLGLDAIGYCSTWGYSFTSLTLQSTIYRNPVYVTREIDGILAMTSLSTNQFHGLNEMGVRIWDVLAEPASVEAADLVAKVQSQKARINRLLA